MIKQSCTLSPLPLIGRTISFDLTSGLHIRNSISFYVVYLSSSPWIATPFNFASQLHIIVQCRRARIQDLKRGGGVFNLLLIILGQGRI